MRNYLYQIFNNIRGRYPHERLRELQSLEYLNREQVKQLQQERLRSLLYQAYEDVPYYREMLSENKIIDGLGQIHLDRFKDLPFLTKGILRSRWEDLKSDDLKNKVWKHNYSSGSTGELAQFIQDQAYDDYMIAVKALFDGWSGCHPGHKKVLLWGSERDLLVGHVTLRDKVSRWFHRQIWLNAYQMTPPRMEEFRDEINRFKPDQILAYVESLYEFARFIKSRNIPIFTPKAIMTSAGMLYPYMRTMIEEVFHISVFNRYGSREVGDIACECEKHEGLHIVPMTHYIEIIRPDGSLADFGEEGEIAVTLLTNYSMPMIRYKIGDRGVLSDKPCSCGRAWPILKEITGRITDSFIRKDGGLVDPKYFIHLFSVTFNKDMIKKFQVIQENYETVRFKLVLFPEFSSQAKLPVNEIEKKVKLAMGSDCKVILDVVEDIPPSSSGKYRFMYSLINK